jgi:hypothetical protein
LVGLASSGHGPGNQAIRYQKPAEAAQKETGRITRSAPFAFTRSNSQKEQLIESFDLTVTGSLSLGILPQSKKDGSDGRK